MDSSTIKAMIKRKCQDTINRLNALHPDYALNMGDIEIKYTLRGTTAGRACYSQMWVNFHLKLADSNIMDYLNQTIPHEICHIYQYHIYGLNRKNNPPHGTYWQKLMRELGLNPNRCHDYNVSEVKQNYTKKRYIYRCIACAREYTLTSYKHNIMLDYHRGITDRFYQCRCRNKIKYTGKIREF